MTIILILSLGSTVFAQSETQYPVYIIQKGDTLTQIAQKFGIPLSLLIKVNPTLDANNLVIGRRINIPGMQGITGVLQISPVPFGSSLESLAMENNLSVDQLTRINRITSPDEIFSGSLIIIPSVSAQTSFRQSGVVVNGVSMLEFAFGLGLNSWEVATSTHAYNSSLTVVGDPLFLKPNTEKEIQARVLPFVQSISIDPLPLVQGSTITIKVKGQRIGGLAGKLAGYPLNFFSVGEGEYIALQGIHALASPGISKFELTIKDPSGRDVTLQESILLRSGNYGKEPNLTVDPKTIDPENTRPEDGIIASATSSATKQKQWSKIFRIPVDEPSCIKSWYGNRRSYNGSPYTYFHTGLDYGVCATLNIYAPAPGKVVFSGPLVVRGNATIIDHGWGVFSGFWHQKSINVKVGDSVAAGQLVGQIGGTGRVTGPHLHWEVWVNGVQVEPLDWLENIYPQ